jgi:hypothetical protein
MPQPTTVTPKQAPKRTTARAGRPRPEDLANEVMRERSKDEKKMDDASSTSNALKVNKPNLVTVEMKMDMVSKVRKLQDEGLTKLVEYIG